MSLRSSLTSSNSTMLIICFGVIFTDMVAYGVISPSLPSLARALSATDAQMGYAFAGYPVALTVAILPLGALVDRFGRNWLIIAVSMVALAGSTTMIAYASTISTLIAARALQGVSSAAAWVATQPLIAGPVGPDGRQKHSMSLVTTAAGLGVIVGPLLGGIGQLETPFLINGALAFLWAIAAAAFLTRRGTGSSGSAPATRDLLRRKGIVIACVAIFCSCACFGIMELLLPLRLDRQGYPKLSIGILFGVFSVLYVGAQPLISSWIDRRGSIEPIYLGGIGLAVAMIFVGQARQVATWSVLLAIMGSCSGALFLASMVLIRQHSAEEGRGRAYALWNLAYSLGYLVGPVVGGHLSSLLTFEMPFYLFALVLLVGALGIRMLAPTDTQPAQPPGIAHQHGATRDGDV